MNKKKEVDYSTSPELDEELKKELDKSDKKDYKSLIDQIQTEYKLSWWYMKPKIDEWSIRLKLYNNQKRDKEAIGDPLLFTIHQTILASLYSDRLSVDFLGRENGDEERAENQNSLAEFDYEEMGKDEIDYAWDWDASFFGRGLLLFNEFDRDSFTPVPEVIDMMTWLRDPRATSVNGDKRGRGSMRFGGREIRLTKQEMEKMEVYQNLGSLKSDSYNDLYSMVDNNTQARTMAQGTGDVTKFDKLSGENADYRLLEWVTWYEGKRVLVTLANNKTLVIRVTPIKNQSLWPIIDRSIYPIAHDWDGVSIPDLIEDKQRARAKIQNLSLQGITIGLHPTYIYDSTKITNRAHLNIDFNKHIPVSGNPQGAIEQINKQQVKQEVQWILDVLDTAAQKSTSTPDIQQGNGGEEKRTATELNLISAKVDTRYGLSAKIFGWSEKRFWVQWYSLYKNHFERDIDEKVIRIAGSMGSKWKSIKRSDIIGNSDPDIKIESKQISETIKFNELQKYRLFFKDVMAVDPQNANVRFALKEIAKLSGFRKEKIDQVLPPTFDEMDAEEENELLSQNKVAQVEVQEDDFIHMEFHNKAEDTPAKKAHIDAHRKSMMLKRVNPSFNTVQQNRMMESGMETPQFMGGGTPSNVGASRMPQLA